VPIPETLRKLLTAPGPSGYEQAPAAVFRDAAAAFAEVEFDAVGSTIARVPGTGGGPSLAIVGHIDEIGLIVHHIDDARARVRIGDVAVIGGEPVELPNGRLVSRSLDNRLGCFVALEAARLVAEAGGAPGDVIAAAVAQEEITFAGARTTAYRLEPDVAIAVDVTFATDPPGTDEKELGRHRFGSGPVLTRGSTLDPAVFELLHETAEAEGIPFTVSASARSTGTDADAIHLSRAGVPTGVISIPLRYMHSPVEMVQLSDVENTARLIAAFARQLKPDTDFRR
jgi:endoglucanase